MSLAQTQFQNARNVQVHNGQFNNIGPNGNLTIINNHDNGDPVSTILWPHVAAGAIFDSAERYAAGKCHPGTRKKIIERITNWIADRNTTHRVLWLHGPAGGGKSAIEHTMCEILKQQHPESYGASFFFKSGDKDRGNAIKLFTTLAYQLALHFPSIRSKINDSLSRDPSLPTKSMEIQFLSLIGQPLLDCQDHLSHSPILVIDGLDECADDEGTDTQRNIITLIGKLIVEHNLPLRVMIASRPEFWIRDAFDAVPLPSITQVLSLRDDEDADKDIKAYLINGFEKIRVENKRVMRAVVPPWPSEKTIRHFVDQASGQYIYASTVLRFVGKASRVINPQKQLKIITSPGPNHALGFSELDRLYIKVLSTYPESELETLKRVLGGLLVYANTSIVTVALGVKPDDVALVLDALSSLIDIEKPEQLPENHLSKLEPILGSLMDGRDSISFCHLSFRDFLTDESRSGAFHVDLEGIRHEIVSHFFQCNPDQIYEIGPRRFVNLYHFEDFDSIGLCALDCLRDLGGDAQDTLFFQVAERLASFNPVCRSADSLLSFMRGLDDLQIVVKDSGFVSVSPNELQDAIPIARKSAMDALFLCNAFKVTPALVYLADYRDCTADNNLVTLNELSAIPGTVDVISTIRHLRHFLRIGPYWNRGEAGAEDDDDSLLFRTMNIQVFHEYPPQNGSRIWIEWNTARIFLAHHYLKIILSSDTYDRNSTSITFLQIYFFNKRETSDICTEEYFQNPNNLCILAFMTDLPLWTRFHQIRGAWRSESLMDSILCWFDRQLTNQQTLRLLQDYDKSLQQSMTTTMTYLRTKLANKSDQIL